MKIRTLLTFLFAAALVVGCSSSEPATNEATSGLPGWYLSPPSSDSEYMYAIGEGTSSRRSMARNEAMQSGKAALASKLESEVSAMQKNFEEETTSGANSNYSQVFTDVSKSVAQQTLRGVDVDETHMEMVQNGTKYNVILLMRLPVGEAANSLNQALQNTLSKDEELYTKFKASKAFEDMKNSIDEMKNGSMPSNQ